MDSGLRLPYNEDKVAVCATPREKKHNKQNEIYDLTKLREKNMIIIGVDGGGTKTAIEAFAAGTGEPIAKMVAGPMNYNFIGVDAAVENLLGGIQELNIRTDRIAAIGIGDPSIDDCMPLDAHSSTALFIEEIQKKTKAAVFLRSDAYITLFGLTQGKEPAVLQLSGTGAMAVAQNSAGEIRVAGGWGRLTGDEGGGYYIATEAIKAALHAADGIGLDTALLPALLEYFDVGSPRELIGIFYGDPEPDIAGFAKTAAKCAEAGDRKAQQILLDAAGYLSAYTSALVEWSGSKKVGVYGSVICSNPLIRREYEKTLQDKYDGITVMEPPVSAAKAAALYAGWMLKNQGF